MKQLSLILLILQFLSGNVLLSQDKKSDSNSGSSLRSRVNESASQTFSKKEASDTGTRVTGLQSNTFMESIVCRDSLFRSYYVQWQREYYRTSVCQEKYFQQQYCDYYIDNLKHRRETFLWQQWTSKVIFWTVLIIVFIGIFFAAMQFTLQARMLRLTTIAGGTRKTGKGEGDNTKKDAGEEDDKGQTKMGLSKDGFWVSSPMIGVFILLISLAFFYLYLAYVYPVTEFRLDNIPQIPSK